MAKGTLVMKFGGTSVGSVAAMNNVLEIVKDASKKWNRIVLVASAFSGVTDSLLDCVARSTSGDQETVFLLAERLKERHKKTLDALVMDTGRKMLACQQVDLLIDGFTRQCQAVSILGEASPRVMDAIVGFGEKISVRVIAFALEEAGLAAVPVDATQVIITDECFQNAIPDMDLTREAVKKHLEPLLDQGIIPVVTGFLGGTQRGIPTTLGRGGSDYSASILGVALNADEVWIWTDVDGVMTADPRLVPAARTIPILSYREVAEMAYYGAKVLHPKSIHPVIAAGIGLRVCNTFNPSGAGTRLVASGDKNGSGTIKAITAIRGMSMVTLAGRGMLGVPGVAGRIFSAVATTGISVPLIVESTSEQSICFAAPKKSVPDVLAALQKNLRYEFDRHDIDQAWASEEVDIITIICPGIRQTPGIAGKIFSLLGDHGINVLAISFGASDVSINLVISADHTLKVVSLLHDLVS
ncbi:MAG TPA: aspartate kinase [Anaerolineaceae bacterium]